MGAAGHEPHLEAFHTGTVLVPGIEIKLQIPFNSPEFSCFGTRMTDKKYPTLGPNDIQAKFYLSRLTLKCRCDQKINSYFSLDFKTMLTKH